MLRILQRVRTQLKHPLFVLVLSMIAMVTMASEPVRQDDAGGASSSEFCEVLHRFNAEKKISDPEVRQRYEGEYGEAGDTARLRTWKIQTVCGEFLVATPLWADVSPPVLAQIGEDKFEDSLGATWKFKVGKNSVVTGVLMTSADGTVNTMKVWGDPHENLNGKR